MRRALLVAAVMLAAAPLSAQDLRVEIGLAGYYPAGEWTRCRISGLDNVPDGSPIKVWVSDMLVREYRVERGVAEGPIIIPDEAPSISIQAAWWGRESRLLHYRVAPDDLARLKCVKDRLPVVFVGDNTPDADVVEKELGRGPILPIRMTAAEFWAHRVEDLRGFSVFAFGVSEANEAGWRQPGWSDRLTWSVLVVRHDDVIFGPWRHLNFEGRMGALVSYRELAEQLPVPRGSVRPDLYEIFGPPEWSASARRATAAAFCLLLMVVALLSVLHPLRLRWLLWLALVVAAVLLIAFTPRLVAREHALEKVSVVRNSAVPLSIYPEDRSRCVTFVSRAHLPKGDLGREALIAQGPEFIPVAAYRGQWEENPVRVDESGRVWRTVDRVPSRDVAWSCGVVPRKRGGAGEAAPPDPRTQQIRAATKRWFHATYPGERKYRLVWQADAPEAGVFSAGTLVVTPPPIEP